MTATLVGSGMKTRFRHYVNIGRTEARLRRLLGDFEWGRMDEIFLRPADAAGASTLPAARLRNGALPC